MKPVLTPADLKAKYRLERLEPFGLEIVARQDRDITRIAGTLLRSLLRAEKLVVFRGFAPLTREELVAFCSTYPSADFLNWESGPVMEMKVDPNAKNYLFSREEVPFHWDGAFHQVPSYLVFNCLEAPTDSSGGETLFCNTEQVWETATTQEQESWPFVRLTYRTEKLAHYGGSVTVDLVQKHPHLNSPILRFAEPVTTLLNPVSVAIEGLQGKEPDEFLSEMRGRIYDSRHCYRHTWRDGDLLFADNHALLHGRNAFEKDCPRHLKRVQIL